MIIMIFVKYKKTVNTYLFVQNIKNRVLDDGQWPNHDSYTNMKHL